MAKDGVDNVGYVRQLKDEINKFDSKTDLERLRSAIGEARRAFDPLFDKISDGILIFDKKSGAILDGNERAAEFTGKTTAELVASNIFEVFKDSPAFSGALNELIEKKEANAFCEGTGKDGKARALETHLSILETKEMQFVLMLLKDVSERRNAGPEIKNENDSPNSLLKTFNELSLQMSSETNPDESLLLLVKKGREFLNADACFIALFDESKNEVYIAASVGLKTEEFKNMRFPMGKGLAGLVAETKKAHACEDYFADKNIPSKLKHSAITAEGFISAAAVPIQLQNKCIGVIYAANRRKTTFSQAELDVLTYMGNLGAIEISRKWAMQKLKESESRYSEMTQQSPDPIVIIDPKFNVLFLNNAAEKMLGIDAKDVLGKHFTAFNFLTPQNVAQGLKDLALCFAGTPPNSEYEICNDKKRLILETHAQLLKHEGKVYAVQVSFRDITTKKDAEKALKESEEKYAELVEKSPDPIILFDSTGKFLYTNPSGEKVIGYKAEELVGRRFTDFNLIHPDEIAKATKILAILFSGWPLTDEIRILKKDKTYGIFEIHGILLKRGGKEHAVQVIFRDITGRKQAEEALKERIKQLQAIYGTSKILEESTNLKESLGKIADLVKFAQAYPEQTCVRISYRNVEAKTYNYNSSWWAHSVDIGVEGRKIGTIEVRHSKKKEISSAETNMLKEVESQIGQITERKKAEKALKESEAKYAEMIEQFPEAIITLDITGNFLYLNPAAENAIGRKSEEMIGKHFTFFDLMPEKQIPNVMKDMALCFSGNLPTREYEILRKDKSVGIYEAHPSLIKWGNGMALQVIFRDITENKQAAEKIREAEIRYRTLFEQSPEGVLIIDPETLLPLEFNDAACRQLGYSREEFANLRIPDYKIMESSKEVEMYIKKIQQEGQDIFETKHRTKNGEIRNVLVITQKITLFNKTVLHCIYRDITERRQYMNKLEQSRQKYRQLVELAQEGVWAVDAEGKTTFANPAMARILGYEFEEMLGKTIYNFMDDAGKELAKSIAGAGASEKDNRPFEFVRKDGKRIYVKMTNSKILDESGNEGTLSIAVDITEQKTAEEALHVSEMKFRKLFEENNDAIFIADPKTRMLIDCNRKAEQMMECPRAEILNIHIEELNPEANMGGEIAKGLKNSSAGEMPHVESEIFTKKGKKVPVLVSPTFVDLNGVPILMVVVKDISEQKKSEKALRESESLYRALIETTNTGYVVIDSKGIALDANDEYARLTGRESPKEIIGKPVVEWTAEHDKERNAQEVKKCFEKGYVRNLEIDYVHPDGTFLPIEINATVITSQKGVQVLTICRDISERKEAEKVKTEFLSVTSHELRTPITPMKAQLQMVLQGYLGNITDEQKKSLGIVLRNTDHLDRLISDILDISKLQSGAIKYIFSPANLGAIVEDAVETMKIKANSKNITLEAKTEQVPEMVLDASRISQVLINLVNNAIKFTPPGGSIKVEVKKGETEATVKVVDTGIGISPEDQQKLFRPFVQLDSGISRKYEGSGLGLAICKGIVVNHGGKIWIESEAGKGAAFIFTLPLKTSAANRQVELFDFDKDKYVEKIKDILNKNGYEIIPDKKEEFLKSRAIKEDGSFEFSTSLKDLEKRGHIRKKSG